MKKILFTLCLSATILSCKNANNTQDNNNSSDKVEQSTPIEVTENTESLTDSIQVKNIQVGGEDPNEKVKFHASYPSTLYDFINQAEEEFVQTYFDEFKENADRRGDDAVGGLDFGQHFQLVENSPEFITFLIERYTSYGNNYDTQFFTHIYDLKAQKQIQFSDLFASEEDFHQFVRLTQDKLTQTFKQRIEEMDGLTEQDKRTMWQNSKDMLLEGSAANDKNYHAFSWDQKGNLKVYFDKYQLASGNFGSFEVSFTPEEYSHLINPQYQGVFHVQPTAEEEITTPAVSDSYQPRPGDVDCGKEPCVALTFDDGPSVHTAKLLDILKENNVKATFFVLGKSAQVQKNTLRRTYQEGHQIGNHSWDHKDLKNLAKSSIEHQIHDTNDAVKDITGEAPHLMRPPYGSMNSTVKEVANMPIILWNLDPLDWKDRDAKTVADRMSKANKNGIVLAHDIHKTTVEAIPQVIKALKDKGYHLVTIDQLFAGQELKNGQKYSQRK
ncbi:polysaccharide deacetylase family protein [Flavobacteriaceae bacterium Ap0902]|nr:polysaccharide deacetylase family protein [Flavobacteriaceae bacterium Ap0902]